jgi:hypothetical protein
MAGMKLHLISQNVQGLNAPEAPQRLHNFKGPTLDT